MPLRKASVSEERWSIVDIMRKSLLSGLLAVTLALGACSSQETASTDSAPAPHDAAPSSAAPGDGLPVDATAEPNTEEACPYLDTQWVADTNGQRMTRTAVDKRFSTPACIFWSYPEDPQATVVVREMPDVEQARAVVDWAAPVDSTELAEFAGWSGGRGVFDEAYSVYAVQKDNKAVLVWSNQLQTLKAELIAQEAIKNLGL